MVNAPQSTTIASICKSLVHHSTSAWAVLFANLVPLAGVLLFGWEAFDIVFLYWAENIILGAIIVLMICTWDPIPTLNEAPTRETKKRRRKSKKSKKRMARTQFNRPNWLSKLGAVLSFLSGYGVFCLGHGLFVVVLFTSKRPEEGLTAVLRETLDKLAEHHLWWAIAIIAAGHLYSFYSNYLHSGVYRTTIDPEFFIHPPYGRMIVLHLAIIFGGWITQEYGMSSGVLIALIVGKTVLELKSHIEEKQRTESGICVAPNTRIGVGGERPNVCD
jgi:hypothetical protein